MAHVPQIKIPATYMRGGTSKGVFFRLEDLPEAARQPGPARDALLLRVIGSPDPYQKQIDGMGGATSSTSKTVILSKSESPDHDVDYLFGQVSIDKPFVDWSGNCGNLSAAVGPFAIANGLVDPSRIPGNGVVEVRIWQANIAKRIVALTKAEIPVYLLVGNHDLPNMLTRANALEIFTTLGVSKVHVGARMGLTVMETRSGPLQVVGVPWPSVSSLLRRDEVRNLPLDRLMHHVAGDFIAQVSPQFDGAVIPGLCFVQGQLEPLDQLGPAIAAWHSLHRKSCIGNWRWNLGRRCCRERGRALDAQEDRVDQYVLSAVVDGRVQCPLAGIDQCRSRCIVT